MADVTVIGGLIVEQEPQRSKYKCDMAFSDDEQQIRDILQFEIAENVKKGWEEVEFVN